MKKIVILSLGLILSFVLIIQSTAQNPSAKNNEVAPQFKGDKNTSAILNADNSILVDNYLVENLVCPKQAAECCKEGTEIVQFTVTESGDVKDFKVINSVCSELDDEVIRVLKTTNGMWSPGLKGDKPVAMTKEVAFMFGDQNRDAIVNYFVTAASRNYKNGSKQLLVKNNPKKAMWYFDKGINYMPNDKALLALRGLCHYELGEIASAEKDWNRILTLGGVPQSMKFEHLVELKGHKAMSRFFAKNDQK